MSRKLELTDISDLREYERERDEFRQHVIELKKRRRIAVGPYVTLLFENRDTMRFQIQEMARAEKLSTDEAIEGELRAYNPLIPDPGHLVATMFIELTSDELLREWLPKLVGIESAAMLGLHNGTRIRCAPEEGHAAQLTRDDITSSVHYITWSLDERSIEAFEEGPVELAIDHPSYVHAVTLTDDTVGELLADLHP